jgi:hypothetical protein
MPAGIFRAPKGNVLSPAELARRTYGSFATAWHVKRDWDILQRAGPA